MSQKQLPELVSVLLIPIIVYVSGTILERVFGALYNKWTGGLIFKQETQGDMATLTIRTNSAVFLDELNIHLEDRALDILTQIKRELKIKPNERIQFSPLDRIRFECVLQEKGDKKLFTSAYVGTNSAFFEENLDVKFKSAREFMKNTKVTIDTSKKTHERYLFKKDC